MTTARDLARHVRNAVSGHGLFSPAGHFSSPTTDASDRRRQVRWDADASVPGIDLAEDAQLAYAQRILELAAAPPAIRWVDGPPNVMFGSLDATVLHAVLALERPGRIVEIGSGYSTAVMLDAHDAIGTTSAITCVEPYPQRLQSLLRPADTLELIEQPVQDAAPAIFDALQPGNLLFVDSSHVAKSGSDVLYLFLEVFPRLAPGVLVEVHDIFWPFSYRPEWITEGRDWTEAYLLRALLTENPSWQIVLFSDWLWRTHPDVGNRIAPAVAGDRPGSIYLRRV